MLDGILALKARRGELERLGVILDASRPESLPFAHWLRRLFID